MSTRFRIPTTFSCHSLSEAARNAIADRQGAEIEDGLLIAKIEVERHVAAELKLFHFDDLGIDLSYEIYLYDGNRWESEGFSEILPKIDWKDANWESDLKEQMIDVLNHAIDRLGNRLISGSASGGKTPAVLMFDFGPFRTGSFYSEAMSWLKDSYFVRGFSELMELPEEPRSKEMDFSR